MPPSQLRWLPPPPQRLVRPATVALGQQERVQWKPTAILHARCCRSVWPTLAAIPPKCSTAPMATNSAHTLLHARSTSSRFAAGMVVGAWLTVSVLSTPQEHRVLYWRDVCVAVPPCTGTGGCFAARMLRACACDGQHCGTMTRSSARCISCTWNDMLMLCKLRCQKCWVIPLLWMKGRAYV